MMVLGGGLFLMSEVPMYPDLTHHTLRPLQKLCEESSYVLIGMNCETIADARIGLDQWVAGLSLPAQAEVPTS